MFDYQRINKNHQAIPILEDDNDTPHLMVSGL